MKQSTNKQTGEIVALSIACIIVLAAFATFMYIGFTYGMTNSLVK